MLPKKDSRNFADSEKKTFSDAKKKPDGCAAEVTDSKGRTNLCCCYVIDEDGRYADPCDKAVGDCCIG